jgi:hypothetical protein
VSAINSTMIEPNEIATSIPCLSQTVLKFSRCYSGSKLIGLPSFCAASLYARAAASSESKVPRSLLRTSLICARHLPALRSKYTPRKMLDAFGLSARGTL